MHSVHAPTGICTAFSDWAQCPCTHWNMHSFLWLGTVSMHPLEDAQLSLTGCAGNSHPGKEGRGASVFTALTFESEAEYEMQHSRLITVLTRSPCLPLRQRPKVLPFSESWQYLSCPNCTDRRLGKCTHIHSLVGVGVQGYIRLGPPRCQHCHLWASDLRPRILFSVLQFPQL
jgi:hypothetical protein